MPKSGEDPNSGDRNPGAHSRRSELVESVGSSRASVARPPPSVSVWETSQRGGYGEELGGNISRRVASREEVLVKDSFGVPAGGIRKLPSQLRRG